MAIQPSGASSSVTWQRDGVVIGPCLSLRSYQEDSDGLSVVSSYCDVNRGRLSHEESSLYILSPDCELYICDGDDDDDDSTDR